MDMDLNFGDVMYNITVSEDIRVDRTNLDDEFQYQAEKFVYYAGLHELAKSTENRLKREAAMVYARVDHEIREEAKASGVKVTEKMIENQAKTHVDFQNAELDYLEAKKIAGILGAAREGFAQRKDMLQSLGANHRAGTDSRAIREEAAKETIGKSRRKPKE